jgi:ribonuclease HII
MTGGPGKLQGLIAGVDEAGRGPLAGPVVAAAVILDPKRPIRGLRDSKQLEPDERTRLAQRIRERALGVAIAEADHHEIDLFNILQATLLAMKWALLDLPRRPEGIAR